MAKLRVREIAESRGLNMSRLQIKAGVSMPSVRRYWYGTRDGSASGEPLKEVDLGVLQALARALSVPVSELFPADLDAGDTIDEGIRMPGLAAALPTG